ncbi:MAG: hypothetical protein M3P06_09680 [Acidobacteriota bacterium]|nr:hypothetical protein [Acidobacteriota bacterium]
MTSEERAQILVTARMLEAAGRIDILSTGLTFVTAAALLFGALNGFFAIIGIAAIAVGIMAKHYAVLIAFDARLFADVAHDKLTAADLDAAFPTKAGRPWSDRLGGARELVKMLAGTTTAQSVAIVLMVFAR